MNVIITYNEDILLAGTCFKAAGVVPVSYTHLDVYKRQVSTN